MVEIKCKVDKIIFYNPENGYTVLSAYCKERLDLKVACKGMINPTVNTTYKFTGDWKTDKYGTTLVAEEYEEVLPDTIGSIEAYLASGLIKGIGPVYAKKIVDALGADTFKVIESKSDRLLKIKGLGKTRAESIWKSWDEHVYVRNLMLFLKDFDISTNFVLKIYRKYGDDSIEIIKENPYRLIYDIDWLGFKKVDNMAIKMGFDFESIKRCEAGVRYILYEAADEGNTYLPKNNLIQQSAVLLEVDNKFIKDAIDNLVSDGILVNEDDCIYQNYLYKDEVEVSDILTSKIISMSFFDKTRCNVDIEEIEKEIGIHYDDTQKQGIRTALLSGVSVITGGPGTGKTTILLGAIRAMKKNRLTIAAAAPTGKAAKRMREVTGLDAKTIHRLLEYKPDQGFGYNEFNKLPYDVVILDEVSMVNIELMHIFLSAIAEKTKIIFVGDVDQLPAIGPGNVLLDLIKSNVVPVVKLDKIYRQAATSDIVVNAHRVNHGEMPVVKNSKPNTDFFFIKENDYGAILRTVPELVKTRLSKAYNTSPYDIQVISPMKKNEIGSINLNNILQKAINPEGPSINYGGTAFRVGDKVMQIVNNYEKGIFNGETGKIIGINTEFRQATIDFDGNVLTYESGDFDELSLAYACTIHKSQGSEYPIVVIPIVRGHYNMMQRNLLYTAITRARNICVIIGDPEMIKRAVGNINSKNRYTKLRERLAAAPQIIKD